MSSRTICGRDPYRAAAATFLVYSPGEIACEFRGRDVLPVDTEGGE